MTHSNHDQFNAFLDQPHSNPDEQPDPRFVAALEQRLLAKFSHQRMTHPIWKNMLQRPLIPALAAAVAVILLFATALPSRLHPGGIRRTIPAFDKVVVPETVVQQDIEIKPTKADSLGVEPDTHFVLTTTATLALADVRQSLAITPAVDFTVTARGKTEFEIAPAKPLDPGTVYQLALGTTVASGDEAGKKVFSWAFQAKAMVRVDSFLPRHKATGVPLDTGIEVTFNTDRIYDADKYITIAPATPGRFEKHGRVIAFVANDPLKSSTLYAVTVRKGIPVTESSETLPADLVIQFETAAKQEKRPRNEFWGDFDQAFTATRPEEAPVVRLSSWSNVPDKPSVTVFRFKDRQDLIDRLAVVDSIPDWAYNSQRDAVVDPTGLTKVGTYPLAVETNALRFPQGFDAGYYLVDWTVSDRRLQTALVVSNLAASLTVTQTDSILWVYDLTTGQPLTGVKIASSFDALSVESDDRGVARFSTPAELLGKDPVRSRVYLTVTAGSEQTVVPAVVTSQDYYWRGSQSDTKYWNYLWTDRTLYRPTDTVNIWGVVRNREKPQAENLTLEVWTWDSIDASGKYIPVVATTATTGDFGSFTASLKLAQLKPGYYSLSAKLGDRTVSSRSFEVRTFTKPAYRITAVPDATAVYSGTAVNYAITTEFFDGTPAPRIKLATADYGRAGDAGEPLTTDDFGRATLTKTLTAGHGYPESRSLSVFPTEAAEGNIIGYADVLVYPAAVTMDPTGTLADGQAKVSLTARRVDMKAPTDVWWDPAQAVKGDPVPNTPIGGKVSEIIVTKTKTGTRYDFIEKTVVPEYEYSQREEERLTFSGTTNAQGIFEKTFDAPGEAYVIRLTLTDSQGRTEEREVYLTKRGNYLYSESETRFAVDDDYLLHHPRDYNRQYKLGESTDMVFTKNGEPVPAQGAFLFLKLQNGLRDLRLTDQPRLTATMTEADVPGVYYTAVWFDGSGFRAPQVYDLQSMQYDESERKLSIAVTPDRASYAPGDTVNLTVKVQDAKGKPVQAAVVLSAIDEALSVIQWDNTPILPAFYRPVDSGLLQLYVSHSPLNAARGAEGGGGGGSDRKDFRDAALFTEVETDRDGTATASFKLPDNITSWRITSQGVSGDLEVGDSQAMVPVTKPVFGTLTMSDEYLAADRPVVIGRAYGSSLKPDTTVNFTFDVGNQAPVSRTGKAFAEQRFTLPVLSPGQYDAKLTVSAGPDRDALIRKFTVVSSRLSKATSAVFDAKPGLTLSGSDQDQTVVRVSDSGRGRVINGLQSLAWSWGKRLDRFVAAEIARSTLAGLTDRADTADTGFEPLNYQQEDGGISLVPYGDSELRTTALAAARADLFDRSGLRRYLVAKLENRTASAEDIGWALLGLANLGEPVLADLDSYVAQPGIIEANRLTAALGYFALGARDKAATIASELFKQSGESQPPFVRLNLGTSNDEHIVNSALFSILAEGLKLPERIGFNAFLTQTFPKDTITNLERALALKAAVPTLDDTPVVLRYRLDGQEQELRLAGGRTARLALTPGQLRTFSVVSVEGPVALTVLSMAPFDPATEPRNTGLRLERSYRVVGASRTAEQSDIIRIDLTPQVSNPDVIDTRFFVTDSLPSGLVLLSEPWRRGLEYDRDLAYPMEVNGQRLTFYSNGRRAFHYFARVLTPGSYAAEPAIIQGQQSRSLVNYSGGQTIEIR